METLITLNNTVSISKVKTNIEKFTQSAEIIINEEDNLFKEHFPGMPTLPGAFIASIIMRLDNGFFQKMGVENVKLNNIQKLSFLKRIIPAKNIAFYLHCNYRLEQNKWLTNVDITDVAGNLCSKGFFIYM